MCRGPHQQRCQVWFFFSPRLLSGVLGIAHCPYGVFDHLQAHERWVRSNEEQRSADNESSHVIAAGNRDTRSRTISEMLDASGKKGKAASSVAACCDDATQIRVSCALTHKFMNSNWVSIQAV